MTDQDVRDLVADAVGQLHGNQEFVQQIRDGLQDTGPFMQGALATMNHINERWMLVPVQERVNDE